MKLRDWIDPEKLTNHISLNKYAIPFLEENPDKIHWSWLSSNPEAIPLLEKHFDKLDWYMLSNNPAAMRVLEENPHKIIWYMLSGNPAAIHLLEQNPDNINHNWIHSNTAAIHLIEQNPDERIMLEVAYGVIYKNKDNKLLDVKIIVATIIYLCTRNKSLIIKIKLDIQKKYDSYSSLYLK
jgi:hypothetical protein